MGVELALVPEAESAQLRLSPLQDQVIGVKVEEGHSAHPDDVLAHRVLHAHHAHTCLQNHFNFLFFFFIFIIRP